MSYNINASMYDPMRLPKLTNALAEEFIAHQLGVPVVQLKFERITALDADVWKHACVRSGVGILPPVTTHYNGISIQYACCKQCAKVHYYFEKE